MKPIITQCPYQLGRYLGFDATVEAGLSFRSQPSALTAADIADQIQAAHNIRILPKDVSNEQQEMKEAVFEGRTAFQQFIHELEADTTIFKRIGRQ
jgi:hypothetical protein